MENPHHVVIVGGGFGGLHAAKTLHRAPVDVTLVDKRNFHLFQPLLYQVATGALSPANIASPLRSIFKRQKNVNVLLIDVDGFDVSNNKIIYAEGTLSYDSLIVAAGVGHSYFGNDSWERMAPGLKSIEEATEIRRRILLAFELAERENDPQLVKELLTFVIVGAGPTGVELAGAIKEIAMYTLANDFRTVSPSDAEVILIEGNDRVLPPFPEKLSEEAKQSLVRLGVKVMTETRVTNITRDDVTVLHAGNTSVIKTKTVLWAAGVGPTKLTRALAEATGAELDRAGRIVVEPDLSIKGHPNIYVVGDMCSFTHQSGKPLPGVAQVAVQQGRHAAKTVLRRLQGKETEPFHYRDLGNLATIGRGAAVADIGRLKLSGFVAWLIWLFVHLMHLVQFQNRMLVFMQWAWSYLTWNRAARLITGGRQRYEAKYEPPV
ncbi:MAG: NAD(P)/FAD-dependent oxidoreductase [Candidatus Hydrogenedentes bacterium]|nr:NAD(P)/FAD-dependent oxidoreductase [Candidatus Hydrogenedentota bacterium]